MDRERALALYDEGRAAMERRDLQAAVAKLTASVAILPTAPSVAALGETLLGLSRYGEAIVHLSAALQMGAGGSRLRALLASALERIGERADALELLRNTLAQEPDDDAARSELRRILSDPAAIVRTANRHRLLHDLRTAVPNMHVDPDVPPVKVLRSIGVYVALSLSLRYPEDRLAPVFQFLNRLAVSPDQEVADLLAGAVFPVLAEWSPTIELAQRMLVGKGRAGFADALALWGPPRADEPLLTQSTVLEGFRLFAPRVERMPEWSFAEASAAFGRHLVEEIMAGASDDELSDAFRLLSGMGERGDPRIHGGSNRVYEAFEHALGELLDSRQPRVRQATVRLLTGHARTTFERLM